MDKLLGAFVAGAALWMTDKMFFPILLPTYMDEVSVVKKSTTLTELLQCGIQSIIVIKAVDWTA